MMPLAIEQRRANVIIFWSIVQPILRPFLPDETKAEIDKLKEPT